MKAALAELGEIIIGMAWWSASWAWGLALTALLLLAPLVFANLAVALVDTFSATAGLAIGVVGAYAISLPPWDARERLSLMLLIGGTTVSVVAWDLIHGSADTGTLLIALAATVIGWPIRRALPEW